MLEIERRFLVKDPSVLDGCVGDVIAQGYLFIDDGYLVRIRRRSSESAGREPEERDPMVAVKGPRRDGIREEFEMSVSPQMASELFARAPWKVFKIRYSMVDRGGLWDVDRFLYDNEGLMIAECETEDRGTSIAVPHWCGTEITADLRYNNENLAVRPFRTWSSS